MQNKNIVLIGMPGAGKSTIGVILAKAVGMQFIDTDLLIQKHCGKKLQEIISDDGIDSFLKTESDVLSSVDADNSVIATGGSAVFSDVAMKKLSQTGVIIFLDADIAEIKQRVDNITTRGIAMAPGNTIEEIYYQRLPLYKKYADITVKSRAPEKTVEEIISAYKFC